jgi:CRISPR system Cascade subunit CasA
VNLLEERWIPVRRASGRPEWIAPHELTDAIDRNPIVALDAARPDFNGALAQFLIGLAQTAWSYAGRSFDRGSMLRNPPAPDLLRQCFAPLKKAFEFDGERPRFMQDLSLSASDRPSENEIGALLIEAPGEQTLERNRDHFVKRGMVAGMCPACTAAALFTLQTNSPSGGAGNRTSLRGGGPLTTLIVPSPGDAQGDHSLWQTVASNVMPRHVFEALCDARRRDLKFWFPWLAPLRELQPREETQPLDVHPSHMFWAMPRRIRLDFTHTSEGTCDICKRKTGRLLRRYVAKNYGMNYKGPWRHPLSPYSEKAAGQFLPVHPRPGGIGYRYWLGWVLGVPGKGKRVEAAAVVRDFLEFLSTEPDMGGFRLWAYGYEMDNMKARCWHEATFPLFYVRDTSGGGGGRQVFQQIVQWLLTGAEEVCSGLCSAVRGAWFRREPTVKTLPAVESDFWGSTEREFFNHVERAVRLVLADGTGALDSSEALRENWLAVLRPRALALFDLHAASGERALDCPEQLGIAHRELMRKLYGPGLRQAMGLAATSGTKPELTESRPEQDHRGRGVRRGGRRG